MNSLKLWATSQYVSSLEQFNSLLQAGFLFFSSQLKDKFEEHFEGGKEQGGANIREEKVLYEMIEMSQRKNYREKDEAFVSWSNV